LILVAALLLAAAPAVEHELGDQLNSLVGRRFTPAYVKCYDDTVTGLNRWECAVDEARRQDSALNTVYRITFAKVGAKGQSALRAGQRAWLARRDQACHAPNLKFGFFDPSTDNGPDPWCMIDETIQRTIWLEQLR
jgi:uncharacterized protein YecT (DUF1311 family)